MEIKATASYVQDKKKRRSNLALTIEDGSDKYAALQAIYDELEKAGVTDGDYQVSVQRKTEKFFEPWFLFEFDQASGNFEIE